MEIDFAKDSLEKSYREWSKVKGRRLTAKSRHYKGTLKIVKFFLKPSTAKMLHRICISVYPFRTKKERRVPKTFGI